MNNRLILIVDDQVCNQQLMELILQKNGYEIVLASSGKEALEILQVRMPDLILLDVMMPEIDGMEVCKTIKSDKRLRAIPIVFITGKSNVEDVVKGFKLGAADYITKPFNTSELLMRVKTQVELKKSQDQLREKNQVLKQMNASKDLFFSIISHDLKSPFQGLIGLTELLYEDIEKMERDEIIEFSKMINESARNLLNLLNNLLEWSILERNKQHYSPKMTELGTIIKKNIRLFSALSNNKKINLVNRIDKPVKAWVDKDMVNTIVRNLVSNAIKYTPQGGKVELSAIESSNGAVLQISDTGVGMDEKTLNNLFRIEKIKSQPGTHNEKGTGLGLMICKELVKKNNGSISVDTTLDKGTTYTIRLPQKMIQRTQ